MLLCAFILSATISHEINAQESSALPDDFYAVKLERVKLAFKKGGTTNKHDLQNTCYVLATDYNKWRQVAAVPHIMDPLIVKVDKFFIGSSRYCSRTFKIEGTEKSITFIPAKCLREPSKDLTKKVKELEADIASLRTDLTKLNGEVEDNTTGVKKSQKDYNNLNGKFKKFKITLIDSSSDYLQKLKCALRRAPNNCN